MSLAEKGGQMMLVGFRGQSLAESPDLETLITERFVGGLVLLPSNAHDPQQIARLAAEAQGLATQTAARIPLFIAINHEGGVVVDISEGVTAFPGNMAIAAASQPPTYAFTAASMAAEELRAMGINMNLAPVLDIADTPLNPMIGVRSFGQSPDFTGSLGSQSIAGYQQNGIIAVAKHFPGYGRAVGDPRSGLPKIDTSIEELERVELVPFQWAIERRVEAILAAPIVVPAWEPTPQLPATRSAQMLTGILRERLGFEGLILADSSDGDTTASGAGQAAVQAVTAGADIVLTTASLETQRAIHQALVAAVESGEISATRIDESLVRILRVKHKYGLFESRPSTDPGRFDAPSHQAVADQIALEAVTLFKDDAALIPLPAGARLLLLSPASLPPATAGDGTLLAEELRRLRFAVTEMVLDVERRESREAVGPEALNAASTSDAVIFGLWQLVQGSASPSDQWQAQLVTTLEAKGKPVLVVAWHDPGAILRIPPTATSLIAYGNTPAQVRAMAAVLSGTAAAEGQLPITVEP